MFSSEFCESFNPLTTNVPHHIETSQLICNANHLTGFYILGTLIVNGLKTAFFTEPLRTTASEFSEAYSELCRSSKMERFVEIVSGF